MARIRKVYRPDMVAHLWANESQDEARNAQGNFYFSGATIYSHGSHFPIARIVRNKGRRAVLLTTRGYSNTTAKHISIVRSACNHLQTFRVADVLGSDHKARLASYKARFADRCKSYTAARSNKPAILESLQSLVNEANAYAEFYGLKTRMSMPANLEAMEAECRELAQKERERKQRAQAKQEKEAQEDREAWLAGTGSYYPCSYGSPIRLRIVADNLETSRGAIVPLDHAKRAFKVVKACKDKGNSYQRNGHTVHLGHFALDSIDTNGNVTAGCHKIEWQEIERVAKLAGVL